MRLYFLRHGPALSRADWGGPDSDRPLSAAGEGVVHDVARGICELGLGIEYVVTSPYERALATARVVHDELALEEPLVEDIRLTPGRFDSEALGEIVDRYTHAGAIMLVGHEPSMTEVLASVVGGGIYVFKKGGLARIDLEDVAGLSGELRWLLPPRFLRC